MALFNPGVIPVEPATAPVSILGVQKQKSKITHVGRTETRDRQGCSLVAGIKTWSLHGQSEVSLTLDFPPSCLERVRAQHLSIGSR